jgi:O-antigen/teichoic acid export membrane protein
MLNFEPHLGAGKCNQIHRNVSITIFKAHTLGIIQKQAIKGSIISYTGVLLGFLTTGLLLPHWFSLEENGVIKLLAANTAIFAQLANLGFASVTTRMFAYFRDKKSAHHGFLLIGVLVSVVGFLLSLLLFYLLKNWLLRGNDVAGNLMLAQYIDMVVPMILATTFFHLFDNYYKVLYNAVKGTLYKEVYQRLMILSAIFLFYFDIVDFHGFVVLYVLAFALPTLQLIFSLIRDREFVLRYEPQFLNRDLVRSLYSVGFFGIVAGFSNIAILNIDSIMVNKYLGLSETGIYGITFFFGTLVIIPSRMIKKISSALLADAFKAGDLKLVADIYKKTSINQLMLGALILIGIWGNIENVFQILPEKFEAGRYVILLIALSNLLEMGAGVSGTIISVSPHYRYMSHFMIVLLLLIIVTNMIFIPLFGLNGAAFASLVSYIIFVLLRFVFLLRKYGMQPFSSNHFKIIAIALTTYGLQLLIPQLHYFVLDIFVRSAAMTIIYLMLSIQFRVSEELMANVIRLKSYMKRS